MEDTRDYYFTFGCGQVHANGYYVITANSSMEARAEMFEQFGNKWSMMYNSAEEAGVEKFNLHRVS